jgi:hypothetical protein
MKMRQWNSPLTQEVYGSPLCPDRHSQTGRPLLFRHSALAPQIWDRRCDFKNIFGEKFGENIGVLCSNYW